MLKLKVRSVGMISAVLLAIAFFMPSSAALASGRSCQQEPNGPIDTCAAVNGSGLKIISLTGSVLNDGTRAVTGVHIQLTGPSGATIKNCSSRTVEPGQTITCTWSPNKNEPAGNYCANSWQLVSGHQIQRGHACVDVHS